MKECYQRKSNYCKYTFEKNICILYIDKFMQVFTYWFFGLLFFFLTFCSTSLDTDDSCNISPKNPAKHFRKTDADVKDKLGEAPKKIFTSLKGVQRTG